ncbi:MAG: S9 family peptidase [Sphingomonas bacterium]|nr:S9 family peptidase [Sphingomonas bacterium]
MSHLKVCLYLAAAPLALAAAAPALAQSAATVASAQVPDLSKVALIPRAALFGNPVRASGQISPDGKQFAFIAPRDGVMNLWVAPIGDVAAAKPLTAETKRPIRQYFWAPDSRQLLFVNDIGGDENFLLYGVNTATGNTRSLTPFTKTRVQIIQVSNLVKDRILVGVNNRDAKWHDVHSLDLKTGKLTPVLMNMGEYSDFLADRNLVLRGASKSRADGGSDYYRIADNKVEATPFEQVGLDDSLSTAPAGYTADGKTLYWIDSRDRKTAALIAQDVATGKRTVIGTDPRADIGGFLADPRTGQALAYGVNYLRTEWKPLDAAIGRDISFLETSLKGDINVTSTTTDNGKWTVAVDPVTAPSSVWLFDRKTRALTKLYTPRPALEGMPLAAMHPVEIRSRDGLTLPSYLTLPPGADANGDGKADRPVPMVLYVHGGPWARDGYGYNTAHQLLANRGYAVLSVNYRGSTGFGKDFVTASNLQWGRKMHDDLLDATDWAVAQGVTTPDKVAIMGGSYGGYATLVGVTMTPDKFACGVDIVGPSNLETLLKTIPPYWEAGKVQFYKRMGDPNTAEGLALLKERSPLYLADKIKVPLLIGQGANDPRVNVAESEQIVNAMKARNIPVTYVVFPDEGHGFARPANNLAFFGITEQFLGKCLGGRAEALGDDVRKSTANVEQGAALVPQLASAAKR